MWSACRNGVKASLLPDLAGPATSVVLNDAQGSLVAEYGILCVCDCIILAYCGIKGGTQTILTYSVVVAVVVV